MQNKFTSIQSGKLKGKKLILPSLSTTRSTKSIVQSSFFDTFRSEFTGKTFIEVFGGSALMAATALSNGVKKSYAIELDEAAYEIMKKNIASLDNNDICGIFGDTFKITPKIVCEHENIILYIDPPFLIRDGFSDIYEKVWAMISTLPSENISLIALEHISSYPPPEIYANFTKFKSKKFGKTTLSYYSSEVKPRI